MTTEQTILSILENDETFARMSAKVIIEESGISKSEIMAAIKNLVSSGKLRKKKVGFGKSSNVVYSV